MNITSRKKIVLLGMMTNHMPVGGVVWQHLHYLVGFRRLGYDVYYVEQQARTPSMFIETPDSDGSGKAAEYIAGVMERFDLGNAWAYQALHEDGRCLGMSDTQLKQLFASADLIINMHGGTPPRPEHSATNRLVYLETDPVQLQIELRRKLQSTIDFLNQHCAFFTFGENIGSPDCGLPAPKQFKFLPTRQPVVIDFWSERQPSDSGVFTTVGNWRQDLRTMKFRGETYTWSKHFEFLKFIDLPSRTSQRFEIALSRYTEEDKGMLERKGWQTRHALDFSLDIDSYAQYIAGSHGEFTVAKDQNVRLRSGWFSDRSATYLAARRPVITQETGFSNIFPTGCGLYGFSDMEELLHACEKIDRDYERNRRCAGEIAREYFDHEVVLAKILRHLGMPAPEDRRGEPFPKSLVLEPIARRPLKLPRPTVLAARDNAIPALRPADEKSIAKTSIIIVTFDNLLVTRLCLETLLAHTGDCEIIIVDNGSRDGTAEYLENLAAKNPRVRPISNSTNLGYSRANNQGLAAAAGDVLILLNNDSLVPPGWLPRLTRHLAGKDVGAVGPVTNRIGNEAEVRVDCRSYGDFLEAAARCAATRSGSAFEIPTLTMFCFAMRRGIFEQIGGLDERFAVGMLEDDDYSMRLRQAGLRLLCAGDVLVYHFGEASFGKLFSDGTYSKLLLENKRRFEEKWGRAWTPYGRRTSAEYESERDAIRQVVMNTVPVGSTVAMASRGDPELLKIAERSIWHFPRNERGEFSGFYPATGAEAVKAVKELSAAGAQYLVFPASSFWWLDHYTELRTYCRNECDLLIEQPNQCLIFSLPSDNPPAISQSTKSTAVIATATNF